MFFALYQPKINHHEGQLRLLTFYPVVLLTSSSLELVLPLLLGQPDEVPALVGLELLVVAVVQLQPALKKYTYWFLLDIN
jgi:hypothetical protein